MTRMKCDKCSATWDSDDGAPACRDECQPYEVPTNPYREYIVGTQHTDDPDTCPYSDDRHPCEVCIAVKAYAEGVRSARQDDLQACGHPVAAIVSSTTTCPAYCGACVHRAHRAKFEASLIDEPAMVTTVDAREYPATPPTDRPPLTPCRQEGCNRMSHGSYCGACGRAWQAGRDDGVNAALEGVVDMVTQYISGARQWPMSTATRLALQEVRSIIEGEIPPSRTDQAGER